MGQFDAIRQQIAAATANRDKTKCIHFLALVHADEIERAGVAAFCRDVGIEPSWELEVKKMIDLAHQLELHGIELRQR